MHHMWSGERKRGRRRKSWPEGGVRLPRGDAKLPKGDAKIRIGYGYLVQVEG